MKIAHPEADLVHYAPRACRTITAISGNTLTLDEALAYMHFGEVSFEMDERGEVAYSKTTWTHCARPA